MIRQSLSSLNEEVNPMEARTTIGQSGELIIPAEYRRALGVQPGGEVILVLHDGELRISSPARALAHAQALVRQYVPAGRSLTAELIAERRAEETDE